MKKNKIKYIAVIWLIILTALENCYCQKIDCNGNIYSLSLGDLSLSVSSETGGRIVSFRRGECELLTSKATHPAYFGATFWLSPQLNYWPPYPTIDKLPYKASISGDRLTMVSQTDETNIRITKEFSLSTQDTALYITYKIENISNRIRKLAPWDVSRVFGGLSFFPVGEKNEKINRSSILTAYVENGICWFPFTPEDEMPAQKLFSTAKDGWLAHYYKNLLFVKCFSDIQVEEIPTDQGEVEIFVAPRGKYIELENHGQYVSLAPKGSVKYIQKWFLLSVGFEKRKADLLNIVKLLNKHI